MTPRVSDLISALSEEGSTVSSAGELSQENLKELLAELSRRPVPLGSLHRLWSLGELSAQVALAYFALWMRQWFASAEAGKRAASETTLRVALKMFHRLGYLRGAIMKVGQTFGNFPDIVPAQFAETLDKLHFEAPPMHFSLLRELVRNELGNDPEELFATFDTKAFAAASLGQVHLARLKSGEQVAVKIQYPGIARTIDADFRNLGALLFPLRLGKDWEFLKRQFEEIHRMLQQETDYEREAESLRRARDLFKPEEGIVVPQVYKEYSTKRVLTTEYIPGAHLDDFLATNPSQELRNQFGTKMYLSIFRLYYARMNYADPHSGNYLFMSDGRLGLIDFGCVQNYSEEECELIRLSEQSTWGGPETIREVFRRGAYMTDEDFANEERLNLMKESHAWTCEPIKHEGPFDFGNIEHLQRGIHWFVGLSRHRYTRSHPTYVYFNRSVFGLRALLYRLRAQVDVRALHSRESRGWLSSTQEN
ncbi:MAG: ABC1 kinase family protein [Candidatus Acidiferrales bacterium]